jgi:hypothetical protein
VIARPAGIRDLAPGQEIIYGLPSQYRPAVAYHGIVVELFDVMQGVAGSPVWRAVRLDVYNVPVRLVDGNALFIVGS